MTDAELDEIQQRLDAAHKGPWFDNGYSAIFSARCLVTGIEAPNCYDGTHSDALCTPIIANVQVPPGHGDTACGLHAADLEFIAHARQDVERLLQQLREQRQAEGGSR